MDIFSALQTSVSGLQAQSYAISNISGNIANSQTTGYKRVDTSFIDLMAEQPAKRAVAGTVLAQAQLTNTIQGNVATAPPSSWPRRPSPCATRKSAIRRCASPT